MCPRCDGISATTGREWDTQPWSMGCATRSLSVVGTCCLCFHHSPDDIPWGHKTGIVVLGMNSSVCIFGVY
ncbi:hypothetical protein KIPB_013344 [Kipferlia bialata]|uniref:Uncharacterized protein n=1 Tax=Kipferlia bialata TaxID=797122 RepID=A0A9K3DA88_9EUKA|nr:hypothetical protein KIPB_013344 [Kipferlia bialata]|eukprot:g13344.t1